MRTEASPGFCFPATFRQEWYFRTTNGGWSDFNNGIVLEAREVLNRAALDDAVRCLGHRHEALRTSFRRQERAVVQVVDESRTPRLDFVEHPIEGERDETLSRAVLEPFRLDGGPLVRIALYHDTKAREYVVIALHHAVCDGWSRGLLIHDLTELYRSRAENRPARLAPVEIQPADYAVWERETTVARDVERWYRRLALDQDGLRLDDSHRVTGGMFQVFSVADIDSRVAGKLGGQARNRGTTLPRLLGAATVRSVTELARDSLRVGFVTANRHLPELRRTVGEIEDTLPLRLATAPDLTWSELIGRFDREVSEAYDRQITLSAIHSLSNERLTDVNHHLVDVTVNCRDYQRHPSGNVGEVSVLFDELTLRMDGRRIRLPNGAGLMGALNFQFDFPAGGGLGVSLIVNTAAIPDDVARAAGRRLLTCLDELACSQ
ncbi:condensation domain-containing protein [Amycolatopsis thermalba]|uniref:Condensation domain-containing protein n=1 Tax=Amycolatopsis thermalba TaxID=944492 RepID=A0ABY4P0R6_9PSEU|nr:MULTISPECIES: condensation domain-containing protein [Amycolatopsis]UQS25917.1 condensation domain-containing protein [Amycolatopsis thermalba]